MTQAEFDEVVAFMRSGVNDPAPGARGSLVRLVHGAAPMVVVERPVGGLVRCAWLADDGVMRDALFADGLLADYTSAAFAA